MTLSGERKIKTREELTSIVAATKQQGTTVGFTSGVFDLLHPGHVDYLERARSKCGMLIAAVNSDSSVRSNKGSSRPICSQEERCQVLAGLECINYVFVFEETNNQRNIELLKPDIYFKAGDYSPEKLTSAPLVEAYGGRVEIIPMKAGHSSSKIIDKIFTSSVAAVHTDLPGPEIEQKPAVFLDRDGTIIEHIEYLHEPEKVKFFPGAIEAVKSLYDAGYRIILITNQPGMGFGYFSKEDFFAVTKHMLKSLGRAGVMVDKIYYCPHTEAEGCACRKPATGLIIRAEKELNVDLSRSFVIGDMTSDIKLGRNAGMKSILVKTGQAGTDGRFEIEADYSAADLGEAARWILSHPCTNAQARKF